VWTHDYGSYPQSVTVAPSGKFVYVTNSGNPWDPDDGSVAMYTIGATTGSLTSIGTINGNCPALCLPSSVVVDPSGKFAYVASGGGHNVEMYTIDATTGSLTSMGTIAAGTDPVSVAVDPSGKFAYVTNSGSNDVSMYTINSTTGSLTRIGMIATGLSPTSIAIHPSGKFAYVTNSGSNDVSMYSIGSTGTLTLIATIGT
jgi:YVTN family beta-propeller protein